MATQLPKTGSPYSRGMCPPHRGNSTTLPGQYGYRPASPSLAEGTRVGASSSLRALAALTVTGANPPPVGPAARRSIRRAPFSANEGVYVARRCRRSGQPAAVRSSLRGILHASSQIAVDVVSPSDPPRYAFRWLTAVDSDLPAGCPDPTSGGRPADAEAALIAVSGPVDRNSSSPPLLTRNPTLRPVPPDGPPRALAFSRRVRLLHVYNNSARPALRSRWRARSGLRSAHLRGSGSPSSLHLGLPREPDPVPAEEDSDLPPSTRRPDPTQ